MKDNLISASVDVARWGSLLYSASQVFGENPDVVNAILGGIGFFIGSFMYGLINQKKSKEVAIDVATAQIKDLEKIISTKSGGK